MQTAQQYKVIERTAATLPAGVRIDEKNPIRKIGGAVLENYSVDLGSLNAALEYFRGKRWVKAILVAKGGYILETLPYRMLQEHFGFDCP